MASKVVQKVNFSVMRKTLCKLILTLAEREREKDLGMSEVENEREIDRIKSHLTNRFLCFINDFHLSLDDIDEIFSSLLVFWFFLYSQNLLLNDKHVDGVRETENDNQMIILCSTRK